MLWPKAQIEVIRPTARFESVKLRTKVGSMVIEDTKLNPTLNVIQSPVNTRKFQRAFLFESSATWIRRRQLKLRLEHGDIKVKLRSEIVERWRATSHRWINYGVFRTCWKSSG